MYFFQLQGDYDYDNDIGDFFTSNMEKLAEQISEKVHTLGVCDIGYYTQLTKKKYLTFIF